MVTSVTSRAKPSRESGTAADTPRSSSITMTWDRAQPSATARPASAYCSRVDSVCSRTWPLVDCRTYTIAARARCSGRIFSCGSPSGCMTAFTVTASRRGRGPCREHRQQRHRRHPPPWRHRRPDQRAGSRRRSGAQSHQDHLPQPADGQPSLPPATVLPRSVSPRMHPER